MTNGQRAIFDAVYSANTAHIMQPDITSKMMATIAEHLPENGVFCQYGPFNVDGQYTSESNEAFDLSLKSRGYGGIRDIQELHESVKHTTLALEERVAMPANNFLLVWAQVICA